MRKWKNSNGDSVEKFAVMAGCTCTCTACSPCTCRPTPTHDVGEQAVSSINVARDGTIVSDYLRYV